MRRFVAFVVLGIAPLCATGALRAAGEPPAWAYAIPQAAPAGAPAAPPDTSIKQLPGSALTFTRQQISDGFAPADDHGWDKGYNFGSAAAVRLRWQAALDAGVDLIATDQYEDLSAFMKENNYR